MIYEEKEDYELYSSEAKISEIQELADAKIGVVTGSVQAILVPKMLPDAKYQEYNGTPEQIFEHPQKENTIRFIKRIKVFEKDILSKDFDFIGFNTSLEEFGRKRNYADKI